MTQRSNQHTYTRTAPMHAASLRAPRTHELVTRLIAAQALILVVVVLITTPSGAG